MPGLKGFLDCELNKLKIEIIVTNFINEIIGLNINDERRIKIFVG